MPLAKSFRDLRVYQDARALAAQIYRLSKEWPKDERYSLTDQIRRSSRSVMANTAEAWRKRRYPKHFVSKLSDAEAEGAETQAWLDVALDCGYVDESLHQSLDARYDTFLGSIVLMQRDADRWCGGSRLGEPSVEYEVDDARGLV